MDVVQQSHKEIARARAVCDVCHTRCVSWSDLYFWSMNIELSAVFSRCNAGLCIVLWHVSSVVHAACLGQFIYLGRRTRVRLGCPLPMATHALAIQTVHQGQGQTRP